MKAIQIREPGGPEVLVLGDVPVPEIGPGELLIEVKAAGVNRPDLAQRAGRYPVPADASPIPGLEVAGIVEAMGSGVAGFAPGDRVMALVHGGGYAEFCKVDHRHAIPVPQGLSDIEAAGLPEVALTVEFNMVTRGGLKSGETLLVHGGSSGIGSHAIARARSLGAIAMTTSRGAEKAAYCLTMGAEHAIDSSAGDWADAVMRATGGRGVDVILDMVGGDFTAANIGCLAADGRYALISLQGGREVTISLEAILRRRLTITGSTLRPCRPR
ncbi:NAD(P)H-quinone oxidoreductase [Breoghania sp. L-A4]|uniref:NAD(P)H-quinone oxidoreductase n=1 Tax=Breoghania sp. L-A4 TaxID=2304600 RepID=UPI003204A5B8